jgi:hypothetical protein
VVQPCSDSGGEFPHILLAMITDGVIFLPYRTLHLSFHMWKVASFSVLAATAMVVLSLLKNALSNMGACYVGILASKSGACWKCMAAP